ncbi:MAG: hypothetical protein ABI183_16880 [Polyangiaceae bacterium]
MTNNPPKPTIGDPSPAQPVTQPAQDPKPDPKLPTPNDPPPGGPGEPPFQPPEIREPPANPDHAPIIN